MSGIGLVILAKDYGLGKFLSGSRYFNELHTILEHPAS